MLKEMSLRGFNDNEDTLVSHLLKKWINPLYLQKDTINQLHASFHAQQPNHLHLQSFLLPHKANTLVKHLKRLHYTRVYRPDQYRYSVAPTVESCKPFLQFLLSSEMRGYLQKLTGKKLRLPRAYHIVSFQHQDYTLLHDEQQISQRMRLVFDATLQWSNDAGGYDVYQVPEHDPLIIHPANNALTLIEAAPNLQYFTKYINSVSKGRKQYRVQGSYQNKKE